MYLFFNIVEFRCLVINSLDDLSFCLFLLLLSNGSYYKMSQLGDLVTPDTPLLVVRHEVRDSVTGQFTPIPGKPASAVPSRSHKRKPLVGEGVSGAGSRKFSSSEGSFRDAVVRGKWVPKLGCNQVSHTSRSLPSYEPPPWCGPCSAGRSCGRPVGCRNISGYY